MSIRPLREPAEPAGGRIPVLYVAPWVDYGGTDTGTVDWFRTMDRERFRLLLVTTQPARNRRLAEIVPYADEVWPLPDMLPGERFPETIADIIHSRGVRVVHVMNSRLGFQLLPDIRCLPDPPAVVVQLHVEEPDRTGYVRYVCTRYGNLVDAFSLVGSHLVQAVGEYGVPADRCHVIPLGVDAAGVFDPQRTRPIEGLEPGVFRILFAGRLVEQKDPMLMVEVAAALRATGADFRVDVVGDGHLEPAVRAAVADRWLQDVVLFHPPSLEMPRWYRAADAVLMTSVFEGVPCAVYEAMAMEVPLVVPALPGSAEVMGTAGGALVDPRDDVAGYVAALRRLMEDGDRRRRLGAAARERVLHEYTLERMAEEHGRLYEDLLARRRPRVAALRPEEASPAPIRCDRRGLGERPLVSVIVPCYEHGQFLPACIESIRAQTYPSTEIVVVDDCSQDRTTREVIAGLERDGGVHVIRQPRNRGPSAARNAGIEQAAGRYILPVDADNLLVPDAVERLVEQLESAGEQIGFIYPNLSYFGNRDHSSQAPAYNLHSLLEENFVDTCSLIDRTVFDAGLRYRADIGMGHEDWDFALQMAAREVYGEPASGETLLLRKWGFTRSDLVDLGKHAQNRAMRERHAALYENQTAIKRRWSPALSIVAVTEVGPGEERLELERLLAEQSCADAEVILRSEAEWPAPCTGPQVRRIPAALAATPAEAVATGLAETRGRHILVTAGTSAELLGDRAFVEKVLRCFAGNPGLGAIALAPGAIASTVPFERLAGAPAAGDAVAVAWVTECGGAIPPVELDAGEPVAPLVRALADATRVEWRRALRPAARMRTSPAAAGPMQLRLGGAPASRPADEVERMLRLRTPVRLPGRPEGSIPRWDHVPSWTPPISTPLIRHWNPGDGRRLVSTDPAPPPGFVYEHELGSIYHFRLVGTRRLVVTPGPGYAMRDNGDSAEGEVTLGYIDLAGLPLLDELWVGRERSTGMTVVIAGEDDPISGAVDRVAPLGYIEPFPLRPRPGPRQLACRPLAAALAESESRVAALQADLAHTAARAGAVQARLDAIVASLPARVYRRLRWIPGLKGALLARRPPR